MESKNRTLRVSFISSVLLLSLSLLTASCDHTNNTRMTPPEIREKVQEKGGEIFELTTSNAVDILFVIDNSESMKNHQENLSRNIHQLVSSVEKNKTLDYHIGITPIFDFRYGNEIKKFNPNGYLLPLKGKTNGQPQYYYTREHNNINLLAESLLIGVLPLKDKNGRYTGPEREELLSPIWSAFHEPALSSPTNQGFYRPEARLAIVIITDADDSTLNLSGVGLDDFLRDLKNNPDGSKISTFGILANKKDCSFVDPGMVDEPTHNLNFLYASQGYVYSLCKGSIADVLSKIGTTIQNKVEKQRFHLHDIPEFGTIKVYLGTTTNEKGELIKNELLPGSQTWGYDPVNNDIVVSTTPKSKKPEDRVISIEYTKVKMTNVINGRAKRR